MSNRISNLMAADTFFSKKRGVRDINRLQKERFRLQPDKARKKIYQQNKPAKPVSSGIDFEQWQIDLAVKVLEGETNG